MSGMEAMTKRVAESFERMSLPILLVSLLLTGFLAYFLVGSLAFTTDLSSFAPDTDSDIVRVYQVALRPEVVIGYTEWTRHTNEQSSETQVHRIWPATLD